MHPVPYKRYKHAVIFLLPPSEKKMWTVIPDSLPLGLYGRRLTIIYSISQQVKDGFQWNVNDGWRLAQRPNSQISVEIRFRIQDSWIPIWIMYFIQQLYWVRGVHQVAAPLRVEVCAVPALIFRLRAVNSVVAGRGKEDDYEALLAALPVKYRREVV